ncbi:MAG TPA: beta/gamma crystallin-related protein [Chitinophagaceae bacterium]|nr:beta/gamma crystallin-related protein [Chitinophagaceae bacterium]
MKPKLFNLILLIGFSAPLSAQVTLYSSCNYQGFNKTLGVGYHNAYDLGIGNDQLSSFRVPAGYTIRLYIDDNFKGPQTDYSEDVSCLPLGLNNKVSSVYISYNGNNNNGLWGNNNNNEGVTLYKDCNYQGYSKTLGEGSFKVYELGIGNDQLSSIRVPNGYSISLFEDDYFKGATTKYDDDISCLPAYWNERTSSVTITRKWNNFGWNNNNNNNNNYAEVVTLFTDCNYHGLSKSLSPGSYRYYDLGIGNDKLSSIRISNGYSITLFQDDNYQGSSIVYNDDVSCLSANWNERASSVIISKIGNNNPGGWNNNNNNNASVTLYSDCNYSGAYSMLAPGYHNLYTLGISNDVLSSIRIPNGYYVILYEDDNYKGASTTIYNDTYCLPGSWDNRTSSIYVGQSGNNNNFQNYFAKVTLYEDCNYGGGSHSLGIGYHALNELGIRNDALSSIRIPQGYSVTLYKDDNFHGSQTTETGDIPCFNSLWNDKVTSIRVFKTGQ